MRWMVGQHMAVAAVTGEAPPPTAARGRDWGICDLFEAPYLNAADDPVAIRLPDGNTAKLPRPPLRCHPPAVGNAANALLKAVGLGDSEISDLLADDTVQIRGHETLDIRRWPW